MVDAYGLSETSGNAKNLVRAGEIENGGAIEGGAGGRAAALVDSEGEADRARHPSSTVPR